MKIKTGNDIVYIPRLIKSLENEDFVKKVFSPSESVGKRPEHLAGIFASKEAFFKAIGQKVDWLEIEIIKEKSGKPIMRVSSELKERFGIENIELSISHDADYAIATLLLMKNEEK